MSYLIKIMLTRNLDMYLISNVRHFSNLVDAAKEDGYSCKITNKTLYVDMCMQ